jgi:hypothetical protein
MPPSSSNVIQLCRYTPSGCTKRRDSVGYLVSSAGLITQMQPAARAVAILLFPSTPPSQTDPWQACCLCCSWKVLARGSVVRKSKEPIRTDRNQGVRAGLCWCPITAASMSPGVASTESAMVFPVAGFMTSIRRSDRPVVFNAIDEVVMHLDG